MVAMLNIIRMLNKGGIMRNIRKVRGGRSRGSHTKSMNMTNITKTKMQGCRIRIMFMTLFRSNSNSEFRGRR